MATRLAQDGFRVHALARRSSDDLSAAAAAGQGAVHFIPFDLDDFEGMPAMLRALREAHGPLYGLVNNAGLGTAGVLATMPVARIEVLVRLNTLAPMVLTRHALRPMMAAGAGGRIVNMASVVASAGTAGLSVYAATKASMVGFTRSLAREVGPLGITVNAVAPGVIATDMTAGLDARDLARVARRSALGRTAEASDVAGAVAYLMSDGARNVTGTVLTVDAGATA